MGDLCNCQIDFLAELADSREEGLDALDLKVHLRIFKYMYLTAVSTSLEMLEQALIQFDNNIKQYKYLYQVNKMPQKDALFKVLVPNPRSL